MRFSILLFLISIGTLVIAQGSYSSSNDTNSYISSQIIDHSGVMDIVSHHRKIKKKKVFAEGFRIQIYNGNNRSEAMKIKAGFYSKFPDLRCYIHYQQPYYRVRVGDYVKQLDAKTDLRRLGRHYPSSFLVPDHVNNKNRDDED